MSTPAKQSVVITVAGETNAGKSKLVQRLINGHYNEKKEATIGVDLIEKTVNLQDDSTISYRLWDTAGNSLSNNSVEGILLTCDILILCYDTTDKQTLANLSNWLEKLSLQNHKKPIILVGTKSDLHAQVETDEVNQFLTTHDLALQLHLTTSAKTNANIEVLEQIIAQQTLALIEKVAQAHQASKEQPNQAVTAVKDRQAENQSNSISAYLAMGVIGCASGVGLIAAGITLAILIVPTWPIALAGFGALLVATGLFGCYKAYKKSNEEAQSQYTVLAENL